MNKPFELIVFDWDGTLVDSLARIVESLQAAIRDIQLTERPVSQLREIVGLSLEHAMMTLYPDESPDTWQRLIRLYRQYYFAKHATPTPLFPQVIETLHTLRNNGYLMAVATGKSRLGLNRSFEETGIGDFFVISRCADESVSKPHPQMLFDIQDALGIETSHMLMIGDSLYDLQMAQAAGAAAIGVCCGVHERLQMEALHPLACLETVASLPQWLHHHSSV